jgi:hypothetical protein
MQMKIENNDIVKIKHGIVLEEENDNWGILYDPDTDDSFALNPLSVLLCKEMLQKLTVNDLITKVHEKCLDVPAEMEKDVKSFLNQLIEKDMAILLKSKGKNE